MATEIMSEIEVAILSVSRDLFISNRWANENTPGSAHIKELGDHLRDGKKYADFRSSEVGSYFITIIENYELAFNDDWLPEKIVGLELSKAKEFIGLVASCVKGHGLENSIPLLRAEYSRLESAP